MNRRFKTLSVLVLVFAALLLAPLAEAATMVSFNCESGQFTVQGPGYCVRCDYTICCALFDDGSTECTTTKYCMDCEPLTN